MTAGELDLHRSVLECVFSSSLSFQLELPLEEFEGKINKSKLRLVLTNGKIQGYILQLFHVPDLSAFVPLRLDL